MGCERYAKGSQIYSPGFEPFPILHAKLFQKFFTINKPITFSIYSLTQHVSCDLIGHSGPDVYLGSRSSSQARDSSSLPLPPTHMGAIKYPSTGARDSSSLPMCYSGAAEGSGGVGGSGKYSPTPAVGSAGLSYHLNPTTLAMLQQHNYIPYFRGIKARWDRDLG